MKCGTLDKKNAQILRGRLGFAYAKTFGLSGRMALPHISEHAFRQPFNLDFFQQQLSDSLRFLRGRLDKGLPRRVFKDVGNAFVILSDASFEPDRSSGLGGVLVASDNTLISSLTLQLSPGMVSP